MTETGLIQADLMVCQVATFPLVLSKKFGDTPFGGLPQSSQRQFHGIVHWLTQSTL